MKPFGIVIGEIIGAKGRQKLWVPGEMGSTLRGKKGERVFGVSPCQADPSGDPPEVLRAAFALAVFLMWKRPVVWRMTAQMAG